MSICIPLGGAPPLLRIFLCYLRHRRYRDLQNLRRLPTWHHALRTFSAGHSRRNENEGPKLDSLLRRRRPLSPLERISGLLPRDALTPDVEQLREHMGEPDVKEWSASDLAKESVNSGTPVSPEDPPDPAPETNAEPGDPGATPASLPGERPLVFGELLVAERKKGRVEFRKMFQLQAGMRLQSSWGTILHDDLAGRPAGRHPRTTQGIPILVRRPSLEDYVLYMKRGPAIAYPKDASTMLMMMDVNEGDCVLESGSGSGAMSLFLSRAVGSRGRVLSVEVRDDHHRRAVKNYNRWRASWRLRRGDAWPDNVSFHKADLCTASVLLDGWGFNSVALDLISPHLVLPTMIPYLHQGAVCTVYVANITQVIDLLEALRCSVLPLLCERIIEVPLREWRVAPAVQKDGQFCVRIPPIVHGDQKDEEHETFDEEDRELTTSEPASFGSVPYIARPHPEQMGHTAFLVKLRKCAQ